MDYYIRYINNDFCFIFDEEKNINSITDIKTTNEIYNRFFEEQSKGKNLRIVNINGTSFEEIFEEFIPEPMLHSPSQEDRLSAIEDALSMLMGV